MRHRLQQSDALAVAWLLSPELAAEIAAEAAQISEATYFRRSQTGLELLAEAIEKWCGAGQPPLTPPPAPRPNESPPLTPYYVPRLELQTHLLAQLENGPGLVLVGLGGIGKSTLATWLAHAQAEDYPDGQLWLDAGGSVAETQQRLGRSLGVTLTGATNAERAAQLRTLLAGRRLLLVLDNLWDDPELPHLRVVGPDSRLVATSRAYPAAARLQLPLLEVGQLAEAEAGHLLAGWLGAGEFGWLNQRLAGHPLALTLIAALVQSGQIHLNDLPAWLTPGQTELDPADTLNRCFDLSYARLAVDDQLRLAELSCFTAHFDLAGAAAIWGLPQRATQAALARLRGQALLERTGPTFRLHDLVRDYARHKLAAPPAVGTAAHRRHAVYFIRHYLYHPGVLDDDQATAPSLDEVWPEVVAGVDWAAQHEPRLAAIAVVLAHTERAALLAAIGEPLLAAVESYATTTGDAEQAVLAETLAELRLWRGHLEAAGQHYTLARDLWLPAGEYLAAAQAQVRRAGVWLLCGDPAAGAAAAREAQPLLRSALPLSAPVTAEIGRLFYWLDVLYDALVHWPELPEADEQQLLALAEQTGQALAVARATHIYCNWSAARERPRTPALPAQAQRLAITSFWRWRALGRFDRADDAICWTHYLLTNRYHRRATRRYARRRAKTTPRLSPEQIRLVSSAGQRWWLAASEEERVVWLTEMTPRYYGAANAGSPLEPGSEAWQWVRDIINLSTLRLGRRRWVAGVPQPADHFLDGPAWQALSGQLAFPLVNPTARLLVEDYLQQLVDIPIKE